MSNDPHFESALKDALDRVKQNPNSHESHGLLGELLYQAGKYSEALEPLEKAAEILQREYDKKPDKIGIVSIELATKMLHSLYMMHSDSLLRLNRFEDAKAIVDKAMKVIDADPDTWNYLGVLQGNSGEHEDALKSFRESVRLDPERNDHWDNLLRSYRQQNRLEADDIERLLQDDRNPDLDLLLLAELHLSGAEYDKTNLIIKQILERNEGDIRALLLLARLKLADGSISESLEVLENILDIDKENEDALWHLARVKCLQGKRAESENTLASLLKINPQHINARALKALLESNEPAAIQTFGVLTIEDYEIIHENSHGSKSESMIAYKMFPRMNHPLGSTVEDVIHALVNGKLKQFTTEQFLKLVNIHTSFKDPSTTTNAVPSRCREFKYFEPGELTVTFMEQGYTRGVTPAQNKSDLIETGDVILLTPRMSMTQGMQLAAMFPVIKDRAEKKLANWPYRF